MKMKHFKNLFFSALVIFMVACDNDDDTVTTGDFDNTDVTALRDSAIDGTWRITQFIDDGRDETSDFDGFTFTFNADGSVVAENGTLSFTGSWFIELDDSSLDDDDDSDELEFNVSFSLSNDFDELSEDWYVIEYSSNSIRLLDDDDDGEDDFLTLTRVQ